MTDHAINMRGHDVRATLDGRKTQIRFALGNIEEPKWKAADRFWVREAFVLESNEEYGRSVSSWPPKDRPVKTIVECGGEVFYDLIPHYRATEPETQIVTFEQLETDDDRTRWQPACRMPRWASRLTLIVESVKVERLRDISEEDAIAEGFPHADTAIWAASLKNTYPIEWFGDLWNEIYGPDSWSANPYVAAVTFRAEKANIEEAER